MNRVFVGLLVVAMIGLCVFFFWPDIQAVFGTNKVAAATYSHEEGEQKGDKKKKKKKDKAEDLSASQVKVLQRWELPAELVEISGIAFTSNDEVASIQDEEGKIFLYNLASRKVTLQVPFAGPGDYEGIAIVGPAAWVLKSDGTLYEVSEYKGQNPRTAQYQTGLTHHQDVEGLTYDQKNNRLLLAIKGKDANSNDYKGIYAFELSSKKLDKEPVYKIELSDPVFSSEGGKKKEDVIQPSDLVVNPSTGELYVLEGAKPKMLIMDASGKPEHLYKLKTSEFPQPEGIDFNSKGDLYISSEGGKGQGTIVKVALP